MAPTRPQQVSSPLPNHVHYNLSDDAPSSTTIVTEEVPELTDYNEHLHRAKTHDSMHADLSLPQYDHTDESRATTATGLIPFAAALKFTPVGHEPINCNALEKGRDLNKLFLVTWRDKDPEDPRKWSSLWRWCTLRMVFSESSSSTDGFFL